MLPSMRERNARCRVALALRRWRFRRGSTFTLHASPPLPRRRAGFITPLHWREAAERRRTRQGSQ